MSLFALVSGLLGFTILLGVPFLAARSVDPWGAWLILSVPCVFLPLTVLGRAPLWLEGVQPSAARLRFRRLSLRDLVWTVGGVVAIATVTAFIASVSPRPDPFHRSPSVVAAPWLIAWLIAWPANILSEELVWRGVVLPQFEARLGSYAWVVNGACWLAFHWSFGSETIVLLLPTAFVVPFICQRTGNTWTAVISHAALSLPGSLAIATGHA